MLQGELEQTFPDRPDPQAIAQSYLQSFDLGMHTGVFNE
jgi:hypothetical protein